MNPSEALALPRPGEAGGDGFEPFYALAAGPLRGFLRGMLRDDATADDLFQETWIRFLSRPPREPGDAARRAYLFTIAARLARDHWRAGRRRGILPFLRSATDGEEGAPEAVDPAPGPAASDGRLDLARALGALAPRERLLLWLAHAEGFDHAEIAAMLELRPASIKVLLHRAREKTRALLAPQEAAP